MGVSVFDWSFQFDLLGVMFVGVKIYLLRFSSVPFELVKSAGVPSGFRLLGIRVVFGLCELCGLCSSVKLGARATRFEVRGV